MRRLSLVTEVQRIAEASRGSVSASSGTASEWGWRIAFIEVRGGRVLWQSELELVKSGQRGARAYLPSGDVSVRRVSSPLAGWAFHVEG
jgi:hypothetical protein